MSGYHLCSDNYKSTIFKGFSTLQLQEEFVDLTLAAEGHLVKVHKNIIAVASPYIKALLKSAPCSSPVLFLNNVRHIILQYIITYIYQGEVDVPERLIDEFVQVGKALHINGINNIPNRTSLVFSETTVAKKTESSKKNIAAHIQVNHINKNHSSCVLQTNQNDPPVTSSIPIVKQINPNVIEISYGNETQCGIPTNNNFVIANNSQTGNYIGTGNEFRTGNLTLIKPPNANNIDTGNDFEIGNDPETGKNVENNNDFASRNNFETANNMMTISYPQIDNDLAINSNNFGNDYTTVDKSQSYNDFAISKSLETNKFIITLGYPQTVNKTINNDCGTENSIATDNTGTGYDFVDGNDEIDSNLQTCNDNEPHINLQSGKDHENATVNASHSGKEKSLHYSIKIQRLDTVKGSEEAVPDINTELNKIDANDLKAMAQYSVTERGSIQLILNRFIYGCHFESKHGHRRRWRCIDYRRSHCPAFVETEDGLIVKRKGLHSHSFHDKKIYDKHKKNLIFSSEGNVKEYISNRNKN